MKRTHRLNLNLATRPLRNRRLFFLLGGFLGLLFLAVTLLATFLFFQSTLKVNRVQADLRRADESLKAAQSEQKRLGTRLQEAARQDQGFIESVNSIILRKSLSWTDFLSKLEEALPDSSYVLSLTPMHVGDTRIQFRIRVVSQNLDDLLALINKLQSLKFSQPRVETEERNDRGQLTSDISVIYERVI